MCSVNHPYTLENSDAPLTASISGGQENSFKTIDHENNIIENEGEVEEAGDTKILVQVQQLVKY